MLKNTFKRFLLLFVDICIFVVSIFLAFWLRNMGHVDFSFSSIFSQISIFYPVIFLLIISLFVAEMYDVPVMYARMARVRRIIYAHTSTGLIAIFLFYLLPSHFVGYPKTLLAIFVFINILLLSVWRVYGNFILRSNQRLKTLLIGRGGECDELRDQVNKHDFYPFYFIDHLSVQEGGDLSNVGKSKSFFNQDTPEEVIEILENILKNNDIKHIVLDIRNEEVTKLLPYIYNLVSRGVRLYDMSAMYQDVFRKMPLSAVGYFWFFEHVTLDKKVYEITKRGVDIVLALPLLFAFLVSLPFVYLANIIKREGDGKVFSVQKRFGIGGRIISIYKYRTMLYTDGGKWREDSDNVNRATRLGTFLRKTNIDEFPQVINILRGEMSFVGPRNDIVDLGEKLSREIPYYMIRYSVRPGISGWAQTIQKEIPHTLEHNITRFQYDLFYVKNRSLLTDFVILLRTVKALLNRIFG